MILAVAGSRSTEGKYNEIYEVLDKIHAQLNITEIVSGGARGADIYGYLWVRNKGIKTTVYKPDWSLMGKAAGMIRNKQIVDHCERLVAFWDGESKGTLDAIQYAKKTGKLTKTVMMPKEQQ